jgi:class 3 adenylate cyclase
MEEIKGVLELHDAIRKNREKGTILFVDLTGSTAYKLLKPIEEAQIKIYAHNDLATKGVQGHDGRVIKYLGDGLMALFQEEKSDKNAICAAITIQNMFKDYNEGRKLKGLDKIQSKIGINSGDIYLWDYIPQGDPQGTTVDVAARITDLAKPDQILCTAICKEECSEERGIKFGETVKRELKGVKEKIDICEVIWQKELKINETMHTSPTNNQINTFLQNAADKEEQGDYLNAISFYEAILKLDPLHFLANLKLGRIIYKYRKELSNYKLEDALKFAEKAKESNPWSGDAKHLCTTLWWVLNPKSLSEEMLEELITEEKSAMATFNTELKQQELLGAANNLAYFYAEKFDKKKVKKCLDEAIKLCEFIEREYKRIRIDQYAAFLDTYGFILMQRRDKDSFKTAYNFFKEAVELSPNRYIWDHLSELDRRADEYKIPLK